MANLDVNPLLITFQAFEHEVRRQKITKNLSGVLDALREDDITLERAARAVTPPVEEVLKAASSAGVKRKFVSAEVTPSPKRHCSPGSPGSNSGSSRRTPKMTTRSMKHRMALRKRPSIRLPKRM